jgi:hypothetical protein
LSSYQEQHRRLMRRPLLMARLMLALDGRPQLQRRTLQVLRRRPEIFQRLLELHAGSPSSPHLSPLHLSLLRLSPLQLALDGLTLGWGLLTA